MIPYDIHNIDLSINDVPVIEGGFGQGTKVLLNRIEDNTPVDKIDVLLAKLDKLELRPL